MEITFENVTITISGVNDAKSAYNLLCKALASIEKTDNVLVEWDTHTYTTDKDARYNHARSTVELFPED